MGGMVGVGKHSSGVGVVACALLTLLTLCLGCVRCCLLQPVQCRPQRRRSGGQEELNYLEECVAFAFIGPQHVAHSMTSIHLL